MMLTQHVALLWGAAFGLGPGFWLAWYWTHGRVLRRRTEGPVVENKAWFTIEGTIEAAAEELPVPHDPDRNCVGWYVFHKEFGGRPETLNRCSPFVLRRPTGERVVIAPTRFETLRTRDERIDLTRRSADFGRAFVEQLLTAQEQNWEVGQALEAADGDPRELGTCWVSTFGVGDQVVVSGTFYKHDPTDANDDPFRDRADAYRDPYRLTIQGWYEPVIADPAELRFGRGNYVMLMLQLVLAAAFALCVGATAATVALLSAAN